MHTIYSSASSTPPRSLTLAKMYGQSRREGVGWLWWPQPCLLPFPSMDLPSATLWPAAPPVTGVQPAVTALALRAPRRPVPIASTLTGAQVLEEGELAVRRAAAAPQGRRRRKLRRSRRGWPLELCDGACSSRRSILRHMSIVSHSYPHLRILEGHDGSKDGAGSPPSRQQSGKDAHKVFDYITQQHGEKLEAARREEREARGAHGNKKTDLNSLQSVIGKMHRANSIEEIDEFAHPGGFVFTEFAFVSSNGRAKWHRG